MAMAQPVPAHPVSPPQTTIPQASPQLPPAIPPSTGDNESDFSKNMQGMFTIVKHEFLTNLKSFRMVVLMAIFVLAVLGGAYGISGLATTQDIREQPNILVWSILTDADGELYLNDGLIYITDLEGNPLQGAEVVIEDEDDNVIFSEATNNNGIVIYYNVSSNLQSLYKGSLKVNYQNEEVKTVPQFPFILVPQSQYVLAQMIDVDDDNVQDDVVILVIDPMGSPVEDVHISVETKEEKYNFEGYTTTSGIFRHNNLKAGEAEGFEAMMQGRAGRDYTVLTNPNGTGSDVSTEFTVWEDDESRAMSLTIESPDVVIVVIASIFIGLTAPIIAIALTFDTVSKERLQNSLDFLLCRPLGRRSIIFGKFLGILLAIALPVTLVNLIAIVIISAVTGEGATPKLAIGFILLTLLFIAIYILLQQIFSTLAKTTGTAIMSGIGIWLLFGMFWGLISMAVNAILGNPYLSDDWIILNNQMSVFNPGGSYQLAISILNGEEIMGVDSWVPFVAMIIWFVVLFIMALEIFRKKANV